MLSNLGRLFGRGQNEAGPTADDDDGQAPTGSQKPARFEGWGSQQVDGHRVDIFTPAADVTGCVLFLH